MDRDLACLLPCTPGACKGPAACDKVRGQANQQPAMNLDLAGRRWSRSLAMLRQGACSGTLGTERVGVQRDSGAHG